jgi:hypothetical protein
MHPIHARRRALACTLAAAAALAAAAPLALASGLYDPSSGGGGQVKLKAHPSTVAAGAPWSVTFSGRLPRAGIVYLAWTDGHSTAPKHPCPQLATEQSFLSAGFGGLLYSKSIVTRSFHYAKTQIRGSAGLRYQFCGYARFYGTRGLEELAATADVVVK